MSNLLNHGAGAKLRTPEEALNWAIEEIVGVEQFRLQLAEAYKHPDAKVGQIRRSFWKFTRVYGATIGNVVALWRTGYLTDDQYATLIERTNAVWATARITMRDLID